MSYKPETPFDSIESSHQYVALLAETVEEVRRDVETAIASATGENQPRRTEALRLVYHNLTKLSTHMTSSRRILNDLRTLRRLLLAEREPRIRSAGSQ
jgi:phosphoribosyl-ATP pyrophosphohydrolase